MNTFFSTTYISEAKLEIKKLQSVIVDALDDIKARDILVFDTTKGTAEFDRVIIATAEVARQTKAMAMNVIEKVKQAGGRIVAMEGAETGEWVLVDCSDAVVHIMQPAIRQYYNLEELWGQKKVAVMTAAEKAADAAQRVIKKKAAELAAKAKTAADKKAAGKKVAGKKVAGKKAVRKKAVRKKATGNKAAGKKAGQAAKAQSASGTAPKNAATKAAKNTAKPVVWKSARKVAAKPAPAKRAVAQKATAKKATAKKSSSTKKPAPKAPVKKPAAKR